MKRFGRGGSTGPRRGDGVVTTREERVAPENSPSSQQRTPEHAVTPQGADGVAAARGGEAADRRRKARDQPLVAPHGPDEWVGQAKTVPGPVVSTRRRRLSTRHGRLPGRIHTHTTGRRSHRHRRPPERSRRGARRRPGPCLAPTWAKARATCSRIASRPASAALGWAMITTSQRPRIRPRSCRSASRSQRLTRFRTTALPTLRLTVSPMRLSAQRVGDHKNSKAGCRTLRPPPWTRLKSLLRRRRSRRGKPWGESEDIGSTGTETARRHAIGRARVSPPRRLQGEAAIARTKHPEPVRSTETQPDVQADRSGVLGANGGHKTAAALRPTTLEDLAAARGLHAGTEAVGPLPLDVARLVGALHQKPRTLEPRRADAGQGRGSVLGEAPPRGAWGRVVPQSTAWTGLRGHTTTENESGNSKTGGSATQVRAPVRPSQGESDRHTPQRRTTGVDTPEGGLESESDGAGLVTGSSGLSDRRPAPLMRSVRSRQALSRQSRATRRGGSPQRIPPGGACAAQWPVGTELRPVPRLSRGTVPRSGIAPLGGILDDPHPNYLIFHNNVRIGTTYFGQPTRSPPFFHRDPLVLHSPDPHRSRISQKLAHPADAGHSLRLRFSALRSPPWRPPESLSPLPCAGPCPSPERIRATQGSDFSGGVGPRLSAGTGLQITGAPPASTQAPAISRVSKSRSSRCSAAPGRRPTRLHCVPVSPRRPSHLAPASSDRLSLNPPPCPPAIPDRRRTAPPHRISGSLDQTARGASPPAPATAEVNRPWSTARTLCPRVRPRRSRLRPSGPRPTALSSAADPRGPPPHRCPRTAPRIPGLPGTPPGPVSSRLGSRRSLLLGDVRSCRSLRQVSTPSPGVVSRTFSPR